MACSGCSRRRQSLKASLDQGLRVSQEVTNRIKRLLPSSDKKYDNIKITAEGVIKKCSKCQKESEPAASAGQIPPLSCDECKE